MASTGFKIDCEKEMNFNEEEATVLQKLIRHEVGAANRLPHLDEDYIVRLGELYDKVGQGIDYWEGYNDHL